MTFICQGAVYDLHMSRSSVWPSCVKDQCMTFICQGSVYDLHMSRSSV